MAARRGMALVIVVVLTAAMLLLAVAVADRLWQAARSAQLGWQGERALHLADAALLQALTGWSPATAASQRVAETDTIASRDIDGARTTVLRTRLSARMFSVEATSTVQDGGVRAASSRIGRTLLLDWGALPAHAALTGVGHITVGDATEILGADAVPAEWEAECHSDVRDLPTVALQSADAAIAAGATLAGAGAPFARLTAAEVISLATHLDAAIGALNAAATVVTSDSLISLDALAGAPACPQWFGDARRRRATHPVCSRRWPVVSAVHPGRTRLVGRGPAQGVLVVAGDLHIDGPVFFSGVLVVGGRLTIGPVAGGGRSELVGATLVRDRLAAGSHLDGPVLLQSSRCAARLALAAVGTPVPQAHHGWTLRY